MVSFMLPSMHLLCTVKMVTASCPTSQQVSCEVSKQRNWLDIDHVAIDKREVISTTKP